ncbi:MAG: 16S rRNA (cytosine(967)-C(5))-methyltransferase RsmB, partial [Sinobacteraceae bacterium]|nr:16S rRNA (cytosine(967)-C(5))-methyltransferase RsmB [Nevskiaceae bacterium]
MADRSRWAPGAAALAAAAGIVAAVALEGRSVDDAHTGTEAKHPADPERSIVRAISLGTLRWYLRLAPAIERLVSEPARLERSLRALLVVAAHQIEYSRNPAQLTVHAAVDAARILHLSRASGLVNAVLRRFVRERIPAQLDARDAVRTAHPDWLIEQLQAAWPAQLPAILAANNAHPPMVLRVNLMRSSVPDYLQELREAGLAGTPLGWAPAAVRLEQPVPVNQLPGFAAGRVSVQDSGAQLAASLLDLHPGMRVLDACAAPGGKTGHILEQQPGLARLLAVDIDADRIQRIRSNLDRLGQDAELLAADVRDPEQFRDGAAFERILVDAPCSSTGVIRRHPDIKLLRRATDIAPFARTQHAILQAAFDLLAAQGRVLYSTCSLLPAENDEVVANFLAQQPAARAVPLTAAAPGAVQTRFGLQLLPGAEAGSDGFYYACIEKTT